MLSKGQYHNLLSGAQNVSWILWGFVIDADTLCAGGKASDLGRFLRRFYQGFSRVIFSICNVVSH